MIIHKEKNFVICQKKAGISSQITGDGKENMIELIAKELGVNPQQVHPVHRLDNPVGGTMVYAITKEGASLLGKTLSDNRMQKRYLAVICGNPQESEATLTDLLFKDSSKNKSYVVKRMRKGVKKASLEYKVLATADYNGNTYSLLQILLHTGRTHQIRVQFASRKMPLTGDRRYGSGKDSMPLGLWSKSLEFQNPFTKEAVYFETEPPKDELPWKLFF